MDDDLQQPEEPLTKREQRALRKEEKQELKLSAKSQGRKQLVMWALFAIAAGVVIWFVVNRSNNQPSPTGETLTVEAVSESDHSKGNPDASVTLIEYSDFQCPACGDFYPVIRQLVEEKKDTLRFVSRHFPLTQIHKNAEPAAWAAEAASKQGKFWEMHDKLFENQTTWSSSKTARDIFIGYAEELGLNKDQFISDMDSDDVHDRVEASYQSGVRAKVNSTPTFFVNGKQLPPPRSYEDVTKAVEAAMPQ